MRGCSDGSLWPNDCNWRNSSPEDCVPPCTPQAPMDSSVAPANCSHASSFHRSQAQDSTIYLTRGSCAISESDRKQIDSGFLMKKIATANDSMAHGSLWSAPV